MAQLFSLGLGFDGFGLGAVGIGLRLIGGDSLIISWSGGKHKGNGLLAALYVSPRQWQVLLAAAMMNTAPNVIVRKRISVQSQQTLFRLVPALKDAHLSTGL